MKVAESKRHRYPQMSITATFPYAVIPPVIDLSLTFKTIQQTERVTDVFRGSFHESDLLCYVT